MRDRVPPSWAARSSHGGALRLDAGSERKNDLAVYYMHVESQSDISDEDAARRVQEGDIDAFGIIVDRYEPKLMRYGRRFLARSEDIEDIVQDAFERVYTNIQGFDASLRLSPWIYRIAHNAFVNALRERGRIVNSIDFDTLIAHAVYEDPDAAQRDRKDMRLLLERGLGGIAPKYREILVLYYFEDQSYKDIADILEVPLGTVSIRLKRAKEALKASLGHTI